MNAGHEARRRCHERVKADQATRRADLTRRLEELARRDGPEAIWQELLDERVAIARNGGLT